MKAIILAAGKGTRLSPMTDYLPKPLIPFYQDERMVPFLSVTLNKLVFASITDITIVVNYKAEMIEEALGDGSDYGCSITYVRQDNLDGNGGALFVGVGSSFNEDVLVTDCDQYVENNVYAMMKKEFITSSADVFVGVKEVTNVSKYAIINHEAMVPQGIIEKPANDTVAGNLAKSGILIVSKNVLAKGKNYSREESGEYTTTQLIASAIKDDLLVKLFTIQGEYSDIGTWKDYMRITRNRMNE